MSFPWWIAEDSDSGVVLGHIHISIPCFLFFTSCSFVAATKVLSVYLHTQDMGTQDTGTHGHGYIGHMDTHTDTWTHTLTREMGVSLCCLG